MFEAEVVLIFNHALTSIVVDKSEDGEDNRKLRNTYPRATKSVDDGPRVAKPSDFGKNETTDQSWKGKIVIIGLRKHVTTGRIADEEG